MASVSSQSARRRLGLLLVPAVVPWSVLVYDRGVVTLVFAWGLHTPGGGSLTTVYHYLFLYTAGLPEYILAWPAAVGLYLVAVASALAGDALNREDRRLTAGVLVLAGLAILELARGFSYQPGRFAVPVGTLFLWGVAWLIWQS